MNLREWGRMALLPAPHHMVRGRLRYIALAMITVGMGAVVFVLRPAAGSAAWWLIAAFLLMGLAASLINWRKVSLATAVPFLLGGDLLAGAILWLNPAHPEVGLLFVLITTFAAALFHDSVVLLHLAVVAAALGGQALSGEGVNLLLFIAIAVLAITIFLRGLNTALHMQMSRNQHMQYLLELLPVLKAHGVQDVVRGAVQQLVKATGSDSGIVFMLDRQRQVLRAHHIHYTIPVSPEEEEAWRKVEFAIGTGLTGWVASTGQSLMTGDAARDPRGIQVPGTPVGDESILLVPLMKDGHVHGVLRLQREGLNKYSQKDLDLLELLAVHVSDALCRAEMEERLARTDALTGVYNRHFLNEWSQVLKPGRSEISVLMIDCRGFKRINDRFGHLEGDRLLQAAARLISESVRAGDLVVRYGGDEFLVVLEQAGTAEAENVAERLRARLAEWNAAQPAGGPQLSLDIGVDTASQGEWRSLLARADARMYASKRGA